MLGGCARYLILGKPSIYFRTPLQIEVVSGGPWRTGAIGAQASRRLLECRLRSRGELHPRLWQNKQRSHATTSVDEERISGRNTSLDVIRQLRRLVAHDTGSQPRLLHLRHILTQRRVSRICCASRVRNFQSFALESVTRRSAAHPGGQN